MALVNESDSDASSNSGSSSISTRDTAPAFPKFSFLPPELRAQIWRAAIPTPGVNFFNAHSFPGDHAFANRSDSPPWLYLDMRRLDVEDTDSDVAAYDPSAWQARCAVRQVCCEARDACAIPNEKRASVTLTRPRRGLFIRAGDTKLRRLTPPLRNSPRSTDTNVGRNVPLAAGEVEEPKVTRTIQVHADDILCLSIENCSFNMPFEESHQEQPMEIGASEATLMSDEELEYVMGWSYDPQLTPLPVGVSRNQYCIELARGDSQALHVVSQVVPGMLGEVVDEDDTFNDDGYTAGGTDATNALDHGPKGRQIPTRKGELIMISALPQEIGSRSLVELTPSPEIYQDRFGDAYVPLPFTGPTNASGCPSYRLTKVWPEKNDARLRYVQSAQLKSPKGLFQPELS